MTEKGWNKNDCVLMFGDNGNKSQNLKHLRSSIGVSWRNFFKRNGYNLVLVDESYTSSKCPTCWRPVKVFKEINNPKPWKREKKPLVKCHALLRCKSQECREECHGSAKIWNRNKLACINIKTIVEHHLERGLGVRPSYLS
ncbi:hypothetical protein GEMRC1_009674 [Eukaryota sp. GEM-RC1]